MKFKNIIIWLLILATISFIFHNSFTGSVKSNKNSDNITKVVIPIIRPIVKPLIKPPSKMTVEQIANLLVRKAAHFSEFALLGAESAAAVISIRKTPKTDLIFMPMFLTLLTGVTDEFIQSFNDRTSKVSDVLIDFSGAISGIIFAILLYHIIRRVKR